MNRDDPLPVLSVPRGIAGGVVRVDRASPGWFGRTGYSGVVATHHAGEGQLALLERACQSAFAGSAPIQSGRGRAVRHLPSPRPGAAGLYVKHYAVSGMFDQARILLRLHRAQKAWRVGLALVSRGIPTPRPVALLHKRRAGSVAELLLVTEEVACATSLFEVAQRVFAPQTARPDPALRARKAALVQRLARFVALLHRAGVYHGDFSAHNLVLDEDAQEPALIDLDAVRSTHGISRRRRLKNLEEFGRNFLDLRVCSPLDRARFLREYLRAWGGAPFAALAPRDRRRRYDRLIRTVWVRTQISLRRHGQRFEPARQP